MAGTSQDFEVIVSDSSISTAYADSEVLVSISGSASDQIISSKNEIIDIQNEVTSVHVSSQGITQNGNFFQTALRLAELDTNEKKYEARANLGLATIDGGEFFTATP